MYFEDLNISTEVLRALKEGGYETPTEVQERCIPAILEKKDIIGRSATGSGKTFAFGIPAVEMITPEDDFVQVLVVCPTRELAVQVTDELRKLTLFKQNVKVVPVYGGADMGRQIIALKTAKIVVGTPGRLMDHMQRRTLKIDRIKLAVLDEADEMFDMGFRDDIETILKKTPAERQTVMFSATMPGEIRRLTRVYMKSPLDIEIGAANATIDEIEQTYIRVSGQEKKFALVEMFKRLSPRCAIVFCRTKRMVDVIAPILNESGCEALPLHGDMRQNERKRVMAAIKEHRTPCLVATDVAARGIDIEDVDYIFNYDFPDNIEYYIHRIGRTGRAGKSGKAVSFIGNIDELVLLNDVAHATKSKITENEHAESVEEYSAEMVRLRQKIAGDVRSDKRPESVRYGGGQGRSADRRGGGNRRPR